jgi:hypothetical protein
VITAKDKENLIAALDTIDVKQMEIDHADPQIKKWFRFGSYSGLAIAKEVIRQLPEPKKKKKKPLTIS